jgi:ribulose-bisphosphate carboxylase large chain
VGPQHRTSRDEVVVHYLVEAAAGDIDAIAAAIAVEQSVEMPLGAIRHAHVHDETVGRVLDVAPATPRGFTVRIGLASDTVGDDPAQLLNMVFGNSSLQPHVQLADVELPSALTRRLGGPRHGIDGWRRLVGADRRALTCTALKPLGLSPADLAHLAGTFAGAGIDLIKDDHGLADQRHAPFAPRVEAIQTAVLRANDTTGGRSHYAPSLVGTPRTLHRQAALARDLGVGVVLVAPLLVGFPVFSELVEEFDDLLFLAHPAFAGAQRIAPPLLLGTLFRLYGADAVIYPNYGGRFSYSAEACAAIAHAARAPQGDTLPALPVPAGGMTVERVGELLGFYGPDTMLLIGGALLSAADQLAARSRQFVTAVHDQRYHIGVLA